MSLCILNQAGEIWLHRNIKAAPEPFLQAIPPYQEELVVRVECIFTWYWLAALCAQEGIPVVLGHALYIKAIHGGKAKHEKIDAHKIAVLLRGGMLPQAYVDPPARRATRDVLGRRIPLQRLVGWQDVTTSLRRSTTWCTPEASSAAAHIWHARRAPARARTACHCS
jgi:hypothetical protein